MFFKEIKKQIHELLKEEEKEQSDLSLYPYGNFSDTQFSINENISTKEFHRICKLCKEEEDENTDIFLDKAYLSDKKSGEFICLMKDIYQQKEKEKQAELQNFMSSVEAYSNEHNLKSYMLTLTLAPDELKQEGKKTFIYEHSKIIKRQVNILRYFMKILNSDRLTKYKIPNFFWLRMLEFTSIGNVHLHEALYLEETKLIEIIDLIGRKQIDNSQIGRTHLTVDYSSWNKIKQIFVHKHISKNEYLLLDYSTTNFFKKGEKGAGQGFIIRVLTKRKEEGTHTKSAISRYIMKYLLKTRNNEHTKHSLQRSVFSFLNISPFSFKRNKLFSLTKFRKIKKILLDENIISKEDKHLIYTLTKAQNDGSLRVKYKYVFSSFNGYVWKTTPYAFKQAPTELFKYDFEKYQKHLICIKSHNRNYWKDFFTKKVIEVKSNGKVFQIDLSSEYEVKM